ncbi:hypothetical protein FHW64_005605 [Variovorax sp. Sphag1AA]|nr:hypothetical protein [Variovorax sp. Sphag1AA]
MQLERCQSRRDQLTKMREQLVEYGQRATSVPRLYLVAKLAGCDVLHFAQYHSMLGAHRVAVSAGQLYPFGSPSAANSARKHGMLPHRTGCFFCPCCVAEQLRDVGASWYMRKHHIEGVDWCPSHKVRLVQNHAKDPFATRPEDWVARQATSLEHLVEPVVVDEFQARYAEIFMQLLVRPSPMEARVLNKLIGDRFGYARATGMTSHKLLSDLVLSMCDSAWATEHFDTFDCKREGLPFGPLDNVVACRSTYVTGTAYALILTSLFANRKDVDAAFEVATLSGKIDSAVIRGERTSDRCESTDSELWLAYIGAGGNHSEVSRQMKCSVASARYRLVRQGLPALNGIARSPARWRALSRFWVGEHLASACLAEAVDQACLERILRVCCTRVERAVRLILFGRRSTRKAKGTTRGQKAAVQNR